MSRVAQRPTASAEFVQFKSVSRRTALILMNVHSLVNLWTLCCGANLVFAEGHA